MGCPTTNCTFPVLDLCAYRGDTLEFSVQWLDQNQDPIDVTSYTAKLQVREKTASPDPPEVELTEIAGITLLADGNIEVKFEAADTLFPNLKRSGVYDLELTSPGGDVTTLLSGTIAITDDVTHV